MHHYLNHKTNVTKYILYVAAVIGAMILLSCEYHDQKKAERQMTSAQGMQTEATQKNEEGSKPADEKTLSTLGSDKAPIKQNQPETTPSEGVKGQQSQTGETTTPHKTGEYSLQAKLVKPEENAKDQTATVQITVTGVQLIDPASTDGKPKNGQGHLHYQVDGGMVIATPQDKLSFHELKPGVHEIKVILAANDHSPMGPQQTLVVKIPN